MKLKSFFISTIISMLLIVTGMAQANVFQGVKAGGDRLVALQNNDGGWDWPLDDGDPNSGTALNTLDPIAKGLAQAYFLTSDASYLPALQKSGTLFLTKTNTFTTHSGYLAAQLDQIFGGTTYTDHVNTYFYGALAAGTYNRNGAGILYDTASYIQMIRDARNSQGIPNLAAWDIGVGLVGAVSAGVSGTELDLWINGLKAEIDELDSTSNYDVIGLAGAVYGLAVAGEDYDPVAGEHAAASSLSDLAAILAGYQMANGGYLFNDDNENIQETSYATMALNSFDRSTYFTNIQSAASYLISIQVPTGGWPAEGSLENNEGTGEALWGIRDAHPAVLWVDGTSGDDGNPGSKDYPLATIQAGIDAASDGEIVVVTDDTYTGTGNKNLDFGNKAIRVESENGPDNCIIDLENDGRGFYFHSSEGVFSAVSGFTITGGNVSGGGIYCENSSPTISNCIINGNSAQNVPAAGGGIYCLNASPAITGCTISNNAAVSGGGIYCSNSSPSITNCSISSNSVLIGWGGGLYCDTNSNPNVTKTTINGNEALLGNGSVTYGAYVDINLCGGGGVYCLDSSPVFTECAIKQNRVVSDYTTYFPIDTYKPSNGAGVYCVNASPSFTNCYITDNQAILSSGGGFYCLNSSSPTLMNCTIAGNSSSNTVIFEWGGGLYIRDSSPIITNSIIWGNTPNQIFSYPSAPTVTYSNVQNGFAGTGNMNQNPLFAGSGDYRLQAYSPSIDAGTSAGAPSIDFEGDLRPYGSGFDMGADESMIVAYQVPGDFSTIQAAIDAALSGDIILVSSGTYNETININKSITLQSSDGAASTTLNGAMSLSVNGITVEGFTINNGASVGGDYAGMYIAASTSGHSIVSNMLNGPGSTHTPPYRGILFGYYVSNTTVHDNKICGWTSGVYINPNNPGANLTFTDNVFCNNTAGIGSDGINNVTITGNTFANNIEGWGVGSAGINLQAHQNDFIGNTTAIYLYSGNQIDATSNYFAPGDSVVGDVAVDPVLTEPNNDADSDDLTDYEETDIYGTNPALADTDGDGIDDGDELAYWGANWDTAYDFDGTLNNLVDPDADDDGFNDGDEIAGSSDPANPSSVPVPAPQKLYIYSNTTDGSKVFTDNSDFGHVVTGYGDVHHDYSTTFGTTVINFDGAGDYLTVPDSSDWDFETDDFTISLWVYFDSAPAESDGIFTTLAQGGTNGYFMCIFYGRIQWYSPSLGFLSTGVTPTVGQWTHLAAVREGNTLNLYVNGIKKISKDCTGITFNSDSGLVLGRLLTNVNNYYFDGYMDEIIISKGVASWTGDFTPPNLPMIPDTDGDGIFDQDEENTYGTDPALADTDGDGIDDGDELAYWGADWNTDYDTDGLNNLVDADADDDGFNDGDEIDAGSDPADPLDVPIINTGDVLYIHSNTTDGSKVFTDSSGFGHVVTGYGDVHHDYSTTFGTTVINFDGAGDYLTVPDSSDWDFETDDFTISLWVYFDSAPAESDGIFTTLAQGGTNGYFMCIFYGSIQWYSPSLGFLSTGVTPTVGQWTHLAAVREGNTLNLYVNGIKKISKDCTGITFNSDSGLVLGRLLTNVNNYYFDGYMDEIIISKGVASWTGDFTPPNLPMIPDTDGDGIFDQDEENTYGTDPALADTDGDGIDDGDELAYWGANWDTPYDSDGSLSNLVDPDADDDGFNDGDEIDAGSDPADPLDVPIINTGDVLYINSNTTDGSTVFTDNSVSGHTVTANGNVHHDYSTTFGTTVINFDGAGDYLTVPDSSDWDFGTDDFTISLWVYFDSAPAESDGIFTTLAQGGTNGYFMCIFYGSIQWYSPSLGFLSTGVTPTVGQWTHLAAVREGNTLNLYVNGIKKISKDCTGITFNSDSGLVLGRLLTNVNNYYFDGYMDEIIISKGVASWTGDFTPPNLPMIPDTDGDGIFDQDEENTYGTDPALADTDGDGIDDGDELAYWGANWDTPYDSDGSLSNLVDPDADDDGFNDGDEIDAGSDPADPLDVPIINTGDVLYINSNTTDGSTVFTDNSVSGHTVTANGNVHHDYSTTFGTTVINFDGAGDYLTVPDSSDWDFGTDDFTISLWVYFDSAPAESDGIFTTLAQGGTNGYFMCIFYGSIQWYSPSLGFLSTGVTPTVGQWTHLAAVREGNTLNLYVNGIKKISKDCTGITFNSDSGLVLGRLLTNVNNYYFDGYMDEIIISKGVASWTGDFMPPNHPGP